MKNERLLGAFGQIEDEFIEEADPVKKKNSGKKSRKNVWVAWGVTAACALVIVGIGAPLIFNHDGAITGSKPEEPKLEGNLDTTSDGKVQDEAGVGETDLVTLTNMQEIRVRIDEMFPDGFRGTIEVGSDDFKEGEQITIVVQDNVTVVQQDGSIFDYDELEPNIPDSDLEVGNSVWVGFQKFDYVAGNGKYNQVFAYHVGGNRDDTSTNYGETIPNSTSSTSGIVVNTLKEPMKMMLPNLREDIRTPMTNEELYEYYDTDLADVLNGVARFEERESTIPKGIYTYADGSIFDMNQFVYYQAEMDYELCVSIGRNTKCSGLISNLDADAQSSEINGIDMLIFRTENGAKVEYYAAFAFGDCDFIVSGLNIEEDVFVKILGTITK